MIRRFPPQFFPSLVALAIAVAVPPIHGQMRAPAPVPQQDASTQITTLHTYSNLVVVDVIVSDSKGNPVHGLKASDFTLLENNKQQSIRNFEEHTAEQTAVIAPPPKLPAGLFSNRTAAPTGGPVNVLLLDYLNTPLDAQPYARKQLIDYLNKAPAGTRIAIFGLTTSLSMLQGFTSDPEVLKAALTMKKGAPQVSQIMSDPVNGGPTADTTLSDALTGSVAIQGAVTQEMIADIQRFEAFETSFQLDMRAKYTLAGFDLLARYLVGIPGRKNVIWFSGSFPLDVEPNLAEEDPNDSVVRNDDELRKTDNLLTRAQVAVYPVDARGVMTDPSQSFTANQTAAVSISAGSGQAAGDATMAFMTQTAQEHETMFAMAEDTGGQAYVNTNGLTQAVAKAIENGSNYYTLTYSPSNKVWDGRFRAIKIKLEDQSGVKMSYRNGYYADDPNDRNRSIAGSAATALSRPTTMSAAMMHGGPNPAEILFKVRIRPAAAPPEDTLIKGNRTNPDPKVKTDGPYKEYGVDLVPDRRQVSCPVAANGNGNRSCAIEVFTYVYNRDGQLVVTTTASLRATLTPANYARMLVDGMAFHQEISVPVKGEYFLRTAIHDLVSDRVGAVEVPVALVAHLQPLQSLPAVHAPEGTTGQAPAATTPPAAPTLATPAPGPATAPAIAPTGAAPAPR